ncbi:PDZ domain-containing protein [Streptomyces sp. NPDC006193]|uniref:PDZ domain-containing protein n=1 Tax=Streptomyces sp. NPDC006193 TaxID=3155717 RepID=UPI0033A09ADA
MEQTALRPRPLPGRGGRGEGAPGGDRQPHTALRRGRRWRTPAAGLCAGIVLVLCGVGLGTVGSTAIGGSGLAEQRGRPPSPVPSAPAAPAVAASPAAAPPGAVLGVEAVDAEGAGALVVGVHVPGPGYAAGLVRGDVVLRFGTARVGTAAGLARAVRRARPGRTVVLTVRHGNGGYQQLPVLPAVTA